MKKAVIIYLEDGRKFSVDAKIVAASRAKYYEKVDPSSTYQEEYDYTMNDKYELTDWLMNNMNWWELEHKELPTIKEPLKDCEVKDYEVI